ncbi:MAG: hypothetical protein JKY34_01285 [Kordiimonadaceae bacterium]|nr:hypothetical protein [Kordiimonadaceae bacterium]
MNIKPIRNEADYTASLKAIEPLMMAEPGSAEADQLEILSTLIEVYEEKHYTIDAPDPIEAIKFHMEQQGLQRADFAAVVGQNRATELLKKQRKLSIDHIRAIVDVWHMPLRALIADYELAKHN